MLCVVGDLDERAAHLGGYVAPVGLFGSMTTSARVAGVIERCGHDRRRAASRAPDRCGRTPRVAPIFARTAV